MRHRYRPPRVAGRPLEHPDAERDRLTHLGIRDELVDELASLAAAQYRRRRNAERKAVPVSTTRHARHAE